MIYKAHIRPGDFGLDIYVGEVFVCTFLSDFEASAAERAVGAIEAGSDDEAYMIAQSRIDPHTMPGID